MKRSFNDKDYSQYAFEDFLQDDFFVYSMTNPDEESMAFWTDFQKRGTDNLSQFLSAKLCIEQINENKGTLSDQEYSELWEEINEDRFPFRGKQSGKRHYLKVWIGVAACIAIFAFMMPWILPDKEEVEKTDIALFASDNRPQANNTSDIQLILSEQKTVVVKEKELHIVYDSTDIKVSQEEISKEESAEYNQLVVPNGKRTTLILADGTKIWVNAGTRLVYPVEFNTKSREIYVDGEVYMEVFRDEKRPFIVKTKNLDVQVLGTKFNVMAYEADSIKEVVLASGSVKVISPDIKNDIYLKPNYMFEYNQGATQVEKVDIEKYISWVDGLYYYDWERLDQIMMKLSRYYGLEITCDAGSSGLECTGKLDLKDDIDKVLEGLCFTAPITYTQDGNKYQISIK